MAATQQQLSQVTAWAIEVRAAARLFANLIAQADYMRSTAFDEIYAILTAQGGSGWTDGRTDGPPHLMTDQDILAVNAWLADFLAFVDGNGSNINPNANTPVMRKLIVSSPPPRG